MKTIFLLATVLASALGAQAQGLVFFQNTVPNRISTNAVPGGAATGRTSAGNALYYYALFYSTSATTVGGTASAQIPGGSSSNFGNGYYAFEDPNWTFAAYGTNSPFAPGRLSSSAQNADGSTTISGVPGGSSAQFVVLGWSANLGSTLTEMETAFFTGGPGWLGESAVSGSLLLGDGQFIPAPGIFGITSPGIPGFTLGAFPIPEPSAFALAVVGVAGMVFFHRKRNA